MARRYYVTQTPLYALERSAPGDSRQVLRRKVIERLGGPTLARLPRPRHHRWLYV